MDAKGFELLMSAKILGSGGVGAAMDAKGFERLMAAKILGKGGGGTIKELEGVPPLTFTANGQPLLDYRIYGNTVQNGTPTPDMPVEVVGCGIRTENLMPSPLATTISNNGITVRSDGAGRYYVSGTATNDAHIVFNIPSFLIPNSVGTGGSGTFSMFNTQKYGVDNVKLDLYYQETLIDSWSLSVLNRTATTYSVMSNKTIDAIGIFVKKNLTVNVQLSPEVTNNGVLPANYEPYGYKLPMVSRGENLFDIAKSGMVPVTSQGNMRYGVDIGLLEAGTYTINYNTTQLVNVFVTTSKNGEYSSQTIVSLPFSFTLAEDMNVSIRTAATSSSTWSNLGITNIVLVPGSTAPDHYIPYYREETPIYIGDTKLAKDEYVSYSEQKVYKYNGELTLKGDETSIYYYGIFEGVQTFYIDISNNSKIISGVQPYLSCNYYPKTPIIHPGVNKTCRYQSPNIGIWDIGRVYFMDNDYTSLSSFKTHLSELYDAGKPLKVVYTLKNAPISIDPPVPLPALPTTKGSTTLDVDTTIKPSNVYIKYKSWEE